MQGKRKTRASQHQPVKKAKYSNPKIQFSSTDEEKHADVKITLCCCRQPQQLWQCSKCNSEGINAFLSVTINEIVITDFSRVIMINNSFNRFVLMTDLPKCNLLVGSLYNVYAKEPFKWPTGEELEPNKLGYIGKFSITEIGEQVIMFAIKPIPVLKLDSCMEQDVSDDASQGSSNASSTLETSLELTPTLQLSPKATWKGPRPSQTTYYSGIEFKSRLEARFAVLLDELRLRYTYERVTFYFSNSISYTPDFYLKDKTMFIELKPTYPSIEEQHRCEKVSKELGHSIVLVYGDSFQCPAQHGGCYGSVRKQKNALRGMGWNARGERLAGDFMFVQNGESVDPSFDLVPVTSMSFVRANTPALTAAYAAAQDAVF